MDIKELEVMFEPPVEQLALPQITPQNTGITNEQLICESQIYILKERAMQKELNADEVRRFATLFDILDKIKKSSDSVEDVGIQKMSDEELLKIVGSNGTTG